MLLKIVLELSHCTLILLHDKADNSSIHIRGLMDVFFNTHGLFTSFIIILFLSLIIVRLICLRLIIAKLSCLRCCNQVLGFYTFEDNSAGFLDGKVTVIELSG